MDFGTAFHMYVLEPELFNDNYIIHEKFDRKQKPVKNITKHDGLGCKR